MHEYIDERGGGCNDIITLENYTLYINMSFSPNRSSLFMFLIFFLLFMVLMSIFFCKYIKSPSVIPLVFFSTEIG